MASIYLLVPVGLIVVAAIAWLVRVQEKKKVIRTLRNSKSALPQDPAIGPPIPRVPPDQKKMTGNATTSFDQQRVNDSSSEIVDLGIDGQSFLFRLLTKDLSKASVGLGSGDVLPEQPRIMELTYFSISVLMFAVLNFSSGGSKEQLLDETSLILLKKSISSCSENIDINTAIQELQGRWREYNVFLIAIFREPDSDPNPTTTLLMQFYDHAVVGGVSKMAVELALVTPVFSHYIATTIDRVKKIL